VELVERMEHAEQATSFRIRRTILRLARSGAAGILATATDTGVLVALVSLGGVSPQVAGWPALVLGSIVMFLGQKYFVFEARAAHTLWRETLLYALVQVVGIVLSSWLYNRALGLSPRLLPFYLPVRLVVNNVVWMFYFFPLWHFVFKVPSKLVELPKVTAKVTEKVAE
jgi:putative flippase GtrA